MIKEPIKIIVSTERPELIAMVNPVHLSQLAEGHQGIKIYTADATGQGELKIGDAEYYFRIATVYRRSYYMITKVMVPHGTETDYQELLDTFFNHIKER